MYFLVSANENEVFKKSFKKVDIANGKQLSIHSILENSVR